MNNIYRKKVTIFNRKRKNLLLIFFQGITLKPLESALQESPIRLFYSDDKETVDNFNKDIYTLIHAFSVCM